MAHEGQLLKALAENQKRKHGIKISETAKKMGISAKHFSAVFQKERLSAEIREKAIKYFGLPFDYFDETPEPQTLEDRIRNLEKQIAEMKEWRAKYVSLLEEYNELLKKGK